MTIRADDHASRSRTRAGALLAAFGVIVAANGLITTIRGADANAVDFVFILLLLTVTVGVAHGLRSGREWARRAGLAISIGGLFFIAPVVGTMLLGGGIEPVGTGWDVLYFPLMTALLVSTFVMLVRNERDAAHSAADG